MKFTCNKPIKLAASLALSFSPITAFSAPQLEEVLVTAQKRTESIQDVPVSINAVSAETMAKNGIGNLEDMASQVPNLNISDSPNANIIIMRGLGSGAGNPAFEQSVGLYVDGIYAGRAAQFQIPFLDVQRVEVLRGPQGVIFGKNSVAGAISIHSEKPTQEFEAAVLGNYEFNYGSNSITGIVSGPLIESAGLGARLVVSSSSDESFMENHYSGDGPGEPDQNGSAKALRLTLDWAPSDTTNIWLKIEDSHYDEEGTKFQLIAYDRTAPQTNLVLAPFTANIVAAQDAAGEDYTFNDKTYTDGEAGNTFLDQDSSSLTLNAVQQLGEFEITYVGGYSEYERQLANDTDFSASDFILYREQEQFEQTSHELRFTSPADGRFVYMGGLFYLHRDLDLPYTSIDNDLQTTVSIPLVGDFDTQYSVVKGYAEESEGFSGFLQGTWNITDSISATLGVRRSFEEKSATSSVIIADYRTKDPTTNPIALAVTEASDIRAFEHDKQTRKEANTDGTFNLQWAVSDDINLYFTHARATKGGGYNQTDNSGDLDKFEYDEERARNFEVGAKMELFDHRLRLNTAAFYTKFDDLQVSSLQGTAFVVDNAGKSVTKGIEMEMAFVATDEIILGLNAALLRARYREFDGVCPDNVNVQSQECQDNGGTTEDYRGKQLHVAPDATGNAFIDYTTPLGNILFNAHLEAKYSDDYYFDSIQNKYTLQEAFWKYNANIGISNLDNTWGVSLSALNITDERTINFGSQALLVPGAYWGNMDDPRMIAMNFRFAY